MHYEVMYSFLNTFVKWSIRNYIQQFTKTNTFSCIRAHVLCFFNCFRNLATEVNTEVYIPKMKLLVGLSSSFVTQIYLLVVGFTKPFNSAATRTCPLSCICVYNNDGLHAICKNPLIDKIPWFSPDTSEVTFEKTNFRTVEPGVFGTATNISILSFRSCKLSRITAGSLNGLHRLSTFHLLADFHFPVTLEKSVFSNQTNLRTISIIRNNLKFIPSDRLCELPRNSKVTSLFLNGNKITHIHMDQCIYLFLPLLSILSLTDNPLVSVSAEDFKPIPNIRSVYMIGLEIKTMQPDVFKYIPHVTTVNIGSDRIISLPDGIFNDTNISDLNLSGKELKYIPQDIDLARSIKLMSFSGNKNSQAYFGTNFQKAVNLRKLVLSYIPIDFIIDKYFENLTNSPIEEIHFNHCIISAIPVKAFDVFSETLQRIYFAGLKINNGTNPLQILTNISMALANASDLNIISITSSGKKNLNKYTFQGFSALNIITVLELMDSNILSIASDTFSMFTRLKHIDLKGNYDLLDNGLEEGSFRGIIGLEHLSLTSNSFRRIPVCSHVHLSDSLKILDMSNNNIEFLSTTDFKGYYNLEKLYLEGNHIKDINDAMSNLTQLIFLRLKNNAIRQGTKNPFKSLSNLKHLDLENNQFSLKLSDLVPFSAEINYLYLNSNLIVRGYLKNCINSPNCIYNQQDSTH